MTFVRFLSIPFSGWWLLLLHYLHISINNNIMLNIVIILFWFLICLQRLNSIQRIFLVLHVFPNCANDKCIEFCVFSVVYSGLEIEIEMHNNEWFMVLYCGHNNIRTFVCLFIYPERCYIHIIFIKYKSDLIDGRWNWRQDQRLRTHPTWRLIFFLFLLRINTIRFIFSSFELYKK